MLIWYDGAPYPSVAGASRPRVCDPHVGEGKQSLRHSRSDGIQTSLV